MAPFSAAVEVDVARVVPPTCSASPDWKVPDTRPSTMVEPLMARTLPVAAEVSPVMVLPTASAPVMVAVMTQ